MRSVNRLGFAVLALAVAGTAPLRAQDHSYTLVSASADSVTYADQSTEALPDGFMRFSVLTVPASGNIAYSETRLAINCGRSLIADLSKLDYAPGGAALPSATLDPTAKPLVAGTLGMTLKGYLCDGADPYPDSKVMKNVAEAVTRAHLLMANFQKLAPK